MGLEVERAKRKKKKGKSIKIPMVNCATTHAYGKDEISKSLREETTTYVQYPVAIDGNHHTVAVNTYLTCLPRAADLYVQACIHTYGLEATSFLGFTLYLRPHRLPLSQSG